MSVIAQAIADREAVFEYLQVEIKALTNVEQFLGALRRAAGTGPGAPRAQAPAADRAPPSPKPRFLEHLRASFGLA